METKKNPPSLDQPQGPVVFNAPPESKLTRFWYLILIIGLVSIAAIFFLWFSNQKLKEKQAAIDLPLESQTITEEEDKQLEKLNKQANSDELWSIEADLAATELDFLDQELNQIENELSLPE